MSVRDILKKKGGAVETTGPDTIVAAAAGVLAAKRIGALVILEGDAIAGILSERDIVRAAAEHGAKCLDRKVSDLMTKKVITADPDQSARQVMELMTENRIRHLPVTEDGKLAGIVTIGDLVKHRLEETQNEVDELQRYVSGSV